MKKQIDETDKLFIDCSSKVRNREKTREEVVDQCKPSLAWCGYQILVNELSHVIEEKMTETFRSNSPFHLSFEQNSFKIVFDDYTCIKISLKK
jgi:hypothetical protein